MNLFAELKRRNVIRATVFYAAAVWALAQGIAQLAPLFGDYDWVARWFVIAAVSGFPFWIAFAWFYELTPQGLKREREIDPSQSITAHSGKKLDRWIFAVMGIAIVLLLTDRLVLRSGVNEAQTMAAAPAFNPPARSIAVLPFVNMSGDKEQDYLSDGLSEELLNALARIDDLQVAARTSSFYFKGEHADLATIAHKLNVASVLEGSVRRSGNYRYAARYRTTQ